MISGLLKKIFGSRNDRLIKQYSSVVRRINALEGEVAALSDEALRAKTDEFRSRLAQGQTLDDLLPEAFAVVREAGKRALGMRHFDVQLIGGMVLHHGKIAEMRTGRARPWSPPCRPISMLWPATGCISSRSTTISPSATRNGWGGCTASSA